MAWRIFCELVQKENTVLAAISPIVVEFGGGSLLPKAGGGGCRGIRDPRFPNMPNTLTVSTFRTLRVERTM